MFVVVVVVADEDDEEDVGGRCKKEKEKAQRTRPRIMTGMERIRILRRPMRSMEWNATRVKRKFVLAMVSEVRVGERKPTREKIVAEKYMREF